MQLLRPYDLPFTAYTTDVPENDAPAWSNATTYAIGDQVIEDHRVYVSTIDSNTNNNPTDENQQLTSAKWLLIGYTNAFRFMDKTIGNKTLSSTTVVITIDASAFGEIEALMIVGTRASAIRIQGFDSTPTEIFDETTSLSGREVFTYYQWFTEPIGEGARRKAIVDDFPEGVETLTITFSGTEIEIGEILVGQLISIGTAIMSPQTRGQVIDYSRVEFNAYGALTQIAGPTRTSMQYLVHVRAESFPIVKDQMDRLAGSLVGAIASETRETANQVGFLGTIKWEESLPRDYIIQFKVEGTT